LDEGVSVVDGKDVDVVVAPVDGRDIGARGKGAGGFITAWET
jgi:hypothetical protein